MGRAYRWRARGRVVGGVREQDRLVRLARAEPSSHHHGSDHGSAATRRGTSWGHAAGRLEESDPYYRPLGTQPLVCSWPKCGQPVTHWTSYRYVTGRAGRVSRATKHVCEVHAQRFADKHGLEITDSLVNQSRDSIGGCG